MLWIFKVLIHVMLNIFIYYTPPEFLSYLTCSNLDVSIFIIRGENKKGPWSDGFARSQLILIHTVFKKDKPGFSRICVNIYESKVTYWFRDKQF